MNKLIIGILVAGALLLTAPLGLKVAQDIGTTIEQDTVVTDYYRNRNIPKSEDTLKIQPVVPKIKGNKIMTLESGNIVVFRGPVTEKSVSQAMREIQKKSRRLSRNKPIYLILDSPGGSVMDGLDLIDFTDALPQKVHTITLFSASMAFQFVQAMGKRYVVRNGTLMSHRASLRGLGGQLDGELEQRYKMIKRKVDYLNIVASKRMKMPLEEYKALIVPEYWVHGFDAVGDNAADEQVLLRCGKSLDGSEIKEFRTFFGPVKVTFSKCPLIRAPEKVDFSRILNAKHKAYLQTVFTIAFEDQERFVKEFILTDKFGKVFPQ